MTPAHSNFHSLRAKRSSSSLRNRSARNEQTRARESFRRTCERSPGVSSDFIERKTSSTSTVACTSAPPHAPADPCSSSAPTCRRSALPPGSCPRPRRTVGPSRAQIFAITLCAHQGLVSMAQRLRATRPPRLAVVSGPWWATKRVSQISAHGGQQFAVDEDKIQEEARYDGKVGADDEHGSAGA